MPDYPKSSILLRLEDSLSGWLVIDTLDHGLPLFCVPHPKGGEGEFDQTRTSRAIYII